MAWLGGVAGNQFQSWFGSKIKEPPPGAEEVFRNHHIRALLRRAVVVSVEKKAVWVREERGNASDLFRDAGEILAARLGELVDEPSGAFAKFQEFEVTAILDNFVANKGKINVLTLDLWSDLVAETPELQSLSEIERADLIGGVHEGFGEALWGLFKHDAATDRQAFAAIELLYLSRILQAVQAIPGSSSLDLSGLVGRIDLLFKEVKQQQVFYFKEILSDLLAVNKTQSVHTELLLKILAAVTAPKAPTFDALHTIPPPPLGFTGREEELENLRQRAGRGGAVITGLKGMGGIGKTALALVLAREWASRFPDAALMLDGKGLAGNAAPSAAKLMEQVILAFHPEAKLPDDPSAIAGIYQSVLHGRKVMILLDNAKDAAQAKPLLPPDGCAVIVTSRSGFAIDGCAPYAVGRMKDGEAEALLRGAYSGLTDEQVNELIRLCAGLPLALKLAASHLALDAADRGGAADVAGYLRKLGGGRLAHLNADAEDAGEVTISETLRLSVEPLLEDEKQAWRRLAIFTSSFCAKAAEVIAGASQEMLDSFLRRSLLEADGADRYRLHDFAADYARAQLSKEQKDYLALAHARHYETVGYEADRLYKEKGLHLEGLALFDRERAQIEAAFAAMEVRQDGAAAGLVIGIANAIVYVGQSLRFHPRQRINWLEAQLRAAGRIGHREAEAYAWGNLGNAHSVLGDVNRAIECYEQLLKIVRELGDRHGEGEALGNLGTAHSALGDDRTAIGYYEQHLAIARESDDRRGEGIALGNLGAAHRNVGSTTMAIGFQKQRLKIAREIGDRRGEGDALGNLGNAHSDLGDTRAAIGYYEQHLEIAREIGDRFGEGGALWNSAEEYYKEGNHAEAIFRAEQALGILTAIENPKAPLVQAYLAEWRGEAG
ncbi:ATP-binding protein [Luteolibacter soli]|uniref:ATP-binding protein n=1 Tax=Luteolibacter soli TaxID=3135280 RepID=UPI003119B7C2